MYYPDIVDAKELKSQTNSLEQSWLCASPVFNRLCIIFGASSLEYSFKNTYTKSTSTTKSITIHRLTIAAHRLWCFAYLITCIYLMHVQHQCYDSTKNDLENFLYVNSYLLKTVNLLLILGGNHLRHDDFFCKIVAFDERIGPYVHSKKDEEYSSLLGRQRYLQFIRNGVAMGAAVLGASTVIDLFYNDLELIAFGRSVLVYIVPNITFALCHIQYLARLQLLYWRAQQINVSLADVLSLAENGAKNRSWAIGLRDSKAYALNVSLNEIRLLHLELNTLTRSLSEAFEYVILTFFASSVLVITITLYSLYIMVHWNGRVVVALSLYIVVWAGLYFGQILLVLHLNDRLNHERRRVISIMYRQSICGSADTLNMVHKFSLQVLYEPRFRKACGIVRLDMSTVVTVISSLTSYLIILIQFDSITRSNQSAV